MSFRSGKQNSSFEWETVCKRMEREKQELIVSLLHTCLSIITEYISLSNR